MKILKTAGFYLEVDSYENDGDYVSSHLIYSETEKDTAITLKILKLFVAPSVYANVYEMPDTMFEALTREISKIIGRSAYVDDMFLWNKIPPLSSESTQEQVDAYMSMVDKLLGRFNLRGQVEGQTTRCITRIKVEYFPKDVYGYDFTELLGV